MPYRNQNKTLFGKLKAPFRKCVSNENNASFRKRKNPIDNGIFRNRAQDFVMKEPCLLQCATELRLFFDGIKALFRKSPIDIGIF